MKNPAIPDALGSGNEVIAPVKRTARRVAGALRNAEAPDDLRRGLSLREAPPPPNRKFAHAAKIRDVSRTQRSIDADLREYVVRSGFRYLTAGRRKARILVAPGISMPLGHTSRFTPAARLE